MTDYNWKTFTKRITIAAEKQKIFDAWSTQAGLEKWFLRMAEFKTSSGKLRGRQDSVQKGDHYRWLWFGYEDTTAEEGEISFSNEKDRLLFTFTAGCIVEVTLFEESGEEICSLQQNMPMDNELDQRYFFIECGKGWTFYMTNLKSILEGGIDLRNKNVEIQHLINA